MIFRFLNLIILIFLIASCAQEQSRDIKKEEILAETNLKQSDSIPEVSVPMEVPIEVSQSPNAEADEEKNLDENKIDKKKAAPAAVEVRRPKPKNSPKIEFINTTFDFGRIVQGEKVVTEYTFTNQGKAPLVIKNAEASCGCTQPIYPFVPIEPGDQGKILIQFSSQGRLGNQVSTIKVTSNGEPANVKLKLIGEVITKKFRDSI